ncbi:MAG: MarR family winged helix-turn-helix transcriptional regulator [Dehalobacterium sp.]
MAELNENDYKTLYESFHLFIWKQMEEDWTGGFSPLLAGLNLLDLRIIRNVSENESYTIRKLLQVLKIPDSTLTSAINRLEKKNIIMRTINPEDRRSYILQLTDYGKKVQKEHVNLDLYIVNKILSIFDNCEDQKNFIKLFEKVAKHL